MTWKVIRQGVAHKPPRIVWQGTSLATARRRYVRLYSAMRQGTLELRDPDGKTVSQYCAPRVRTRW